jgi:mRNA interferase RelE/StbE
LDSFIIFETEEFSRSPKQSFKGQGERIARKLSAYVYPQLRENPFFGKNIKKLHNYSPDTWRYRIGDYRFFYEINEKDKLVIMLTADNRKDAY